MEAPFDRIPGVIATTSGYTGGFKQKPTYLQVSAGTTGHAESVQVMYDPKICSFDTLLDVYWHQVRCQAAGDHLPWCVRFARRARLFVRGLRGWGCGLDRWTRRRRTGSSWTRARSTGAAPCGVAWRRPQWE